MCKEGGFFGTATLHLYIKSYIKNECDRSFNSLKLMYWKKNVFNFEKCCEILNSRYIVEVIQMFH